MGQTGGVRGPAADRWSPGHHSRSPPRRPAKSPARTGPAPGAGLRRGFQLFLGLARLEAHTVDNQVAVSWRGAAVALNGKPVNWSGINIYELGGDGLIQDAKAYFNPAAFQAQLAS
ncbi:hypothetical protein [Kitasatospora sp. NPDC056531]|uniref:hypothetical protein n=1 Tax=Kitasatospora sp. NPDC056531 TaxID=3345856 RepID=UPI0036A3CCCC